MEPYNLIEAHMQRLHTMVMKLPTTPSGDPVYDAFFAHVASYQQARIPEDYATLAAACQAAADSTQLPAGVRSSYTWLGWLALKQLAAVVQRQ